MFFLRPHVIHPVRPCAGIQELWNVLLVLGSLKTFVEVWGLSSKVTSQTVHTWGFFPHSKFGPLDITLYQLQNSGKNIRAPVLGTLDCRPGTLATSWVEVLKLREASATSKVVYTSFMSTVYGMHCFCFSPLLQA